MELDYTSLKLRVSKADMAAYSTWKRPSNVKKPSRQGTFWLVLVVGIIGFVFIASILAPAIEGIIQGDIIALAPIVTCVSIGAIFAGMLIVGPRKQAKMYRFAVQNNIKLIDYKINPRYLGMIFNNGNSRVITEGFAFQDSTEIGNYSYDTGGGRNQTTHTYGYVKIPLVRNLPHMVLDAKANNTLGIVSSLSDSFNKSQKLSLEGNFDKYFTLYAPKEYEADALYVFTPDVMAVMIDEGRNYDIEIVGNELYIYSRKHFNLTSQEVLESMTKIIDVIGAEVRAQTRLYSDERAVQGNVTSNIVGRRGKRLRQRLSFGSVIGASGFVIVYVASIAFGFVMSEPDKLPLVTLVLILVILCIIGIAAIILRIKK